MSLQQHEQNINAIDPKEEKILYELDRISDNMSIIKEKFDDTLSYMKNWLFLLTLVSMVILYACSFLRRKTFENELNIELLAVRVEGQKLHFDEENGKLRNITHGLQKQLNEKIRIIGENNTEKTQIFNKGEKDIKNEEKDREENGIKNKNTNVEEKEQKIKQFNEEPDIFDMEKLSSGKINEKIDIIENPAPLKDLDITLSIKPGKISNFKEDDPFSGV